MASFDSLHKYVYYIVYQNIFENIPTYRCAV